VIVVSDAFVEVDMRMFSGFLIVALVSATANAQTPARTALADVIAEVLAKSPDIVAAQKRYDAARQRPAQERSLPDPMVSAGYSANGRPWPGAGLGTEPTSNIGVMVSQEVPYPGKRDVRASIASRDADAEFQQIEAARLNVIARVKQAYYRLAYADAVTGVLTRNRALLDTLLKVSEGRYAVGQAAQQDVIKAQTQLSILELQLERVHRERATREGELNSLLNRPVATPIGEAEALQLTAFEHSLDALVAAANAHAPMLRRDRLMVERSQLAVDAARKDYKPDFALTGGYYYMGAMPPMYEFRIDVKVPLQRSRRAAAVAEQLNMVDAARSTYDSARLGLQNRLQEDFRMASTSARLARLYRDTVLPQARLALESSMASYQTGAVDFLSVLTNFGTVLEYEMTYFDELATYHTAVSRLEEMTGMPIVH
jgi:cobalt-zinc-cadmium efflux system outer membrane protein